MKEEYLCLDRFCPILAQVCCLLYMHNLSQISCLLTSFYDDIQANNAYIFPGFGLGLIISGAIRVRDDMLLAACKYMKKILQFSFW